MQTKQILICLNPTCQNPRIFSPQTPQPHKQCQQWIINPHYLSTQQYITKTIINKPISLNLNTFQITNIFNLLKIHNWPQQMTQIFNNIKNNLCQQIDHIKSIKIQQFHQILISAKKMYSNLCQNVKKIEQSQNLSPISPQFINQFKPGTSLNLNFLQKAQTYFQKMVYPSLIHTFNFIQSTQTTQNQIQSQLFIQANKKTQQEFSQNININPNQKLQKISSILNQPIIKPKYDPQISLYKTNCWFCQQTISSKQNQSSKQNCIIEFLQHLKSKHQKFILNLYQHRILKYDIIQIQLHNFIHKIQSQQFTQIIVVDRQNAGTIEKPFNLPSNTLWIEVMNKSNKNLAKSQFILANSIKKDSADTIMSIIVYQISKNSKTHIILITKDHFGSTLQEIINNIFHNNMTVIQPKNIQKHFFL